MRKTLLGFLLGVLVGIGLGIYGLRVFTPPVFVGGVVEHYSPSPGATAVPPEGYYVTSMIYVDGLTQDSVGKQLSIEGRLGSVPDSDQYRNYPKLFEIKNR
jgi:hypothetical protein